ncbi:hypothetical protein B0I35DRAFT_447289 [Stachybotrys elegans]|uniref:Rhodopsin domain-containing protein n=1 Tax=Stachybotrys elegans TaxID=80388 RepID=A0A8K0WJL3_9HYPO|nr:hypothetical protein B0I35DRAFT_447289 [Stachybotrys elegans]
MAVINLVLEIILLAIPQTRVWKLQLSKKNKIAVSLVFLLGGFVCVTSAIRVVYFTQIDAADITYEFTIPGIWVCVEMNTAIICACLPVIYSIFRTHRNGTMAARNGSTAPSSKKLYPPTSNDEYVKLESGRRGYDVRVQSSQVHSSSSEDMVPLGPIRVDREFTVK